MGGKVSAKADPEPAVSVFQGPVSDKPYDCEYKLLLVGDSETGETCLRLGFAGGVNSLFSTNYVPSVGMEFTSRIIVLDGIRIRLLVWDLSGDLRYRYVPPNYFRGAHTGVFIVYDVTRKETYDNVSYWLDELRRCTSPEATIMLVGGKCDLAEEKVVDYRTVKEFADERGIMLMEVSAKDGTNVELAFLTLVANIKEADPTLVAHYND